MSHELRTPLNAIIGFTGTLLMKLPGPLTVDQDKQLKTVQGSGRHLLSLINDLLDLAKIESGKVTLSPAPISCRHLFEEVAAALRPAAEAKGLSFHLVLPPPELQVLTDRRALSQILINLTNNAIKFTEHGHIRIEVKATADAQETLEFRVTDTGIGIRIEDQAKLFEAFSQLNATSSRRHEGTGLGLHLSQKLASLMGGSIHFHSTFGKGTAFWLSLPGL